MRSTHATAAFILLFVVQNTWQTPLWHTEDNSSLLTEDTAPKESEEPTSVKRHSQGTFTNDYSRYLETRRAQDFVQWLMNPKRSETESRMSRRHVDGTYTSDVSSYLQDQAAKDFVSWLKMGRDRRI